MAKVTPEHLNSVVCARLEFQPRATNQGEEMSILYRTTLHSISTILEGSFRFSPFAIRYSAFCILYSVFSILSFLLAVATTIETKDNYSTNLYYNQTLITNMLYCFNICVYVAVLSNVQLYLHIFKL